MLFIFQFLSVYGCLWFRVLAAVLWFGGSRDVFAASYVEEMAPVRAATPNPRIFSAP